MEKNKLMQNADKTGVLTVSSKHKPAMDSVSIQVRGTSVNSKVCVRNLGVLTND